MLFTQRHSYFFAHAIITERSVFNLEVVMARHKTIKEQDVLLRMRQVFKEHGYDNASLSLLAKQTGLAKAGLYHHFPNGKLSMAEAVLDDVGQWTQDHVISVLESEIPPKLRLQKIISALIQLYEEDSKSCLIGLFSYGEALKHFQIRLASSLEQLIKGITKTLVDAGIEETTARSRSEQTVMLIQGALVVCRVMDSNQIFLQTMNEIPNNLLKPVDSIIETNHLP